MPASRRCSSGVSIGIAISLVAGILLPNPAHGQPDASSWQSYEVPASAPPAGAAHFVNVGSVTKSPPLRQAWTLVRLSNPLTFDGDDLHQWMSLVEVDCTARAERGLREVGYGRDGRRLYQARSAASLAKVVPGSLGAARLHAICGIP